MSVICVEHSNIQWYFCAFSQKVTEQYNELAWYVTLLLDTFLQTTMNRGIESPLFGGKQTSISHRLNKVLCGHNSFHGVFYFTCRTFQNPTHSR